MRFNDNTPTYVYNINENNNNEFYFINLQFSFCHVSYRIAVLSVVTDSFCYLVRRIQIRGIFCATNQRAFRRYVCSFQFRGFMLSFRDS